MSIRGDKLRQARELVEEVMKSLDRGSSFCGACRCLRHRDKDEWQMAEGLAGIQRKLTELALRLEKHEGAKP